MNYREYFYIRTIVICLFFSNHAVFGDAQVEIEESSETEATITPSRTHIGDLYTGEHLVFHITFMKLFNVATLIMDLVPDRKKNHYVVSFSAETKGFVKWIISYRRYLFRTYLEEVDEGQRFLPHRFERIKRVKKNEHTRIYEFNYDKKEVVIKYFTGDHLDGRKIIPFLAEQNYSDILTLLLNLRYGTLGEIRAGVSHKLLGLPGNNTDKKEVIYTIDFLSGNEEKAKRDELKWRTPGYLVRIAMDNSIITSKNGIIWVLFDCNMLPLMGILKDVIGFGDVVGVLEK